MPATLRIARPAPDEFAPYYARYLDPLGDIDVLDFLRTQMDVTTARLAGVDETRALHRYAPDKWSVKQVLVHMADAERVFAYRAMTFARADRGPLPGFDESTWAPESGADARPIGEIRAELRAVRLASLALFGSFDEAHTLRRGLANDREISVRALIWIIAGHERHHLGVLGERYGLGG